MMHELLNQEDTNFFYVENQSTVLVVEDEHALLEILELEISDLGHNVITASNGQDALTIMNEKHQEIDAVLIDRKMPVMDGLLTVQHMQENPALRYIPVIMLTGFNASEDIQNGIDAGVFYYLTKPYEHEMLASILDSAIRKTRQRKALSDELNQIRNGFAHLQSCTFKVKTLNEAESIAPFVANCFPNSERVLSGIGELLINAIEHGNLGVGYHNKTDLITSGNWRGEIENLQESPENKNKVVTVTVTHNDNGVSLEIEDEGEGFDWSQYMEIDPLRAGHSHGRGIAHTKASCFDALSYNDKGNKVTASVRN